MIDSPNLKTQTSYSLKLHDVRKAVAAYELMHSAASMLQMLPVPALEALRDYVQEEVKDSQLAHPTRSPGGALRSARRQDHLFQFSLRSQCWQVTSRLRTPFWRMLPR